MMLQTSDYADGTSDFRSARLTMKFAREGGVWRIAHFRTENIFARQVEPWNDEENIAVPDQAIKRSRMMSTQDYSRAW